jgi:hypothetical protein
MCLHSRWHIWMYAIRRLLLFYKYSPHHLHIRLHKFSYIFRIILNIFNLKDISTRGCTHYIIVNILMVNHTTSKDGSKCLFAQHTNKKLSQLHIKAFMLFHTLDYIRDLSRYFHLRFNFVILGHIYISWQTKIWFCFKVNNWFKFVEYLFFSNDKFLYEEILLKTWCMAYSFYLKKYSKNHWFKLYKTNFNK